MKRAAVPLAGLVIVALMLAAYALGAYVPASTPRIAVVWGATSDRRATDAVEIVGLRPSTLRGLRSRAANDIAWAKALRVVVEQASVSASSPAVIGRYMSQTD